MFDTGVRPIIDDYLAKEAEKVRDYGEYFSASSAGYCMRKNIMERLKIPHVTKDPRKQRVFSSGHIFHNWIQELTKASGASVAQELELIDDKLMVKGHVDDLIVVRYDENGETPIRLGSEQRASHLILYDYKTAHSKSFTYSKDRPMSYYHKMQVGTYMYMLRNTHKTMEKWVDWGKQSGADKLFSKPQEMIQAITNIKEARVMSISKDDLRLAEKQLMYSDELEREVINYWTTINGHWNKKLLPPCTCHEREGGFMSRENYNPYYFNDQPCSEDWFKQHKEAKGWNI